MCINASVVNGNGKLKDRNLLLTCPADLLLTSEEQLTSAGADNYQKLLPRLGLSDTRPTPEPVRFNANDPLGACLMTSSTDVSNPTSASTGQ
jgi:hypothetical protein